MRNVLIATVLVALIFAFGSCSSPGKNTSKNQADFKLHNNGTLLKKYETQSLPKKYAFEYAKKNGDAVLNLIGEQFNMVKIERFIENVDGKIKDKVRYTSFTDEGDAIIRDLVYDGRDLFLIRDTTKDNYGEKEIRQYRITKIQHNDKEYCFFIDDELVDIIPITDKQR
jgi:hypothetical protein